MARGGVSGAADRSRARTIGFAALAAVLAVAVLEVVSFALLWALAGGPIGYRALQAERSELSQTPPEEPPAAAAEGGTATARYAPGTEDAQVLHPYIGYVEDPQADYVKKNAHNLSAEAINFGFPHNRHDLFNRPASDLLVVVVVGGSVSRQVSYRGQLLLEQGLAGIERFRGRRVEALGLGLGGYKQPQHLIALNYFLALGMHVDMVVNIDGFNEVALPVSDNLPGGVNPFYPRAWDFRVGGIDPLERRLRGEISLLKELRSSAASSFSRVPWRYSMTCGLVWRLVDRRLLAWTTDREQRMLDGRSDRSFQATGPHYEPSSREQLVRDLVAVWSRSSIQMHQLLAARGIEYYHFLQPNQYDEGSKRLTAKELREAFKPNSRYREAAVSGYPALRAAGEELRRSGVRFTDLSGVFKATDEDIYVDTCCHLNEHGIGMLVDRIVEAVAESPGVALPAATSDRTHY
jgi:hypothetical protein